MIKIQNLSHMLLVWALSFVKLLWPLLRFSSCTHDQDTRTPTKSITDSYSESYAKTCFFCPPNNYSIRVSWVSLSKVSYAKKNSMGYAKKRETKNLHAKRHKRKNACQRAWKKEKEKEKKEIKIAHTFKIKAYIQKREIHDLGSNKNI